MFVCDFCSEPALWAFDASDVVIDLGGPVLHESVGGWAACSQCADLIEERDEDALLVRGYEAMRKAGLTAGSSLDALRTIHVAFWASVKDPRRRPA